MSSTSPKFGNPSWVRMRSALISVTASSGTEPSSTIMVPYQIALVSLDADRLEYLDVVAEQREIRKHVDVDRLGAGEIEQREGAVAVSPDELGLVMLHAGMRAFQRPQAARTFFQIRPLVLEMIAVAGIAHVHRLGVGRVAVIGHALGVLAGKAVLGFQKRAVRIGDVIAVARIVVGELPVALVAKAVGFADHDLAAGIAVEPLVDRSCAIGPRCSVSGSASILSVAKMKPR